eukprot:CAMPEP_0203801866 /NCGR_PEP_ID=MMETSP0100_2-20121128/11643_1 /ASSEMBLY_ACC=CAM_ASM_000210 /TAXON_ID=96639 /ORGANISM=" , Strain NY0313808BC1" /LENGTH=42 /DNA_ID= /DNA_START= /DNA_END= /DNA_ORIENTATION=
MTLTLIVEQIMTEHRGILSDMTVSPSDNDFDIDSGTNHDRAQ